MTEIRCEREFMDAMNADRAVLFVHFVWSAPSVVSKRAFESWACDASCLRSDVQLFFVNYDAFQKPLEPLLESVGERHGNGCVIWLVRGKAKAYMGSASRCASELSKTTDEAFTES